MTNIETLRRRLHCCQHSWCYANNKFCNFHTRPFPQGRHPWLRPGIWKVQCLLVFLSIVLLASLWTKFGACCKHKIPGPSQGWRDIEMLWPCQHCCLHSWCYANNEFCSFYSRPFPRPSSLAWTRDLKCKTQCSSPECSSTLNPLNQFRCMSQA